MPPLRQANACRFRFIFRRFAFAIDDVSPLRFRLMIIICPSLMLLRCRCLSTLTFAA